MYRLSIILSHFLLLFRPAQGHRGLNCLYFANENHPSSAGTTAGTTAGNASGILTTLLYIQHRDHYKGSNLSAFMTKCRF